MAATSWADPGFVLANTRGRVCRRDSVVRSLGRFLDGVGLPIEVRVHDLRHTAGTLAERQSVPCHTVSRMLVHPDPAMTLQHHALALDDMRDDAGWAMDDLF